VEEYTRVATEIEELPPTPPKPKANRTHWLYIAVIIAVIAGVIVGLVAPEFGKDVAFLGTMFVSLIKMMIAPVIFCTIVLGIGSVRKAATVGKVGGLAFVYFLIMSTVALAFGLIVGNLLKPGTGLNFKADPGKGAELAGKAHESGGTIEFLQGIIPRARCCRRSSWRCSSGLRSSRWARRASRSCPRLATSRSSCSRCCR
jgi:aerobic C4-dicarboxylate transport protein